MARIEGVILVATADVFEGGKWKTLLIYRSEDGVALERVHRESGRRERFELSNEELAGLAPAAERLVRTLSSADAPSVDASTPSRPASKASSAQGSLRSSPQQGGLL